MVNLSLVLSTIDEVSDFFSSQEKRQIIIRTIEKYRSMNKKLEFQIPIVVCFINNTVKKMICKRYNWWGNQPFTVIRKE